MYYDAGGLILEFYGDLPHVAWGRGRKFGIIHFTAAVSCRCCVERYSFLLCCLSFGMLFHIVSA